jgi:hypothetical protein
MGYLVKRSRSERSGSFLQIGNWTLSCDVSLYEIKTHTNRLYTNQISGKNKWKEAVCNATKILIIGINPNHADIHVWGPLAETKARIGFVGSYEGYRQWVSQERSEDNTEFIGQKWDSCFDETITFTKS